MGVFNPFTYFVVGGGAREHVITWRLRASPFVGMIYVAPGNGATALMQSVVNVPIAANDIDGLVNFALQHGVDRVIVGPEEPLVHRIVDRFREQGIPCFGPTGEVAQLLEGSKVACKNFLVRHGIPTARHTACLSYETTLDTLRAAQYPIVVKANGLCAGKGVRVCRSLDEAEAFCKVLFIDRAFGEAGTWVVIEDYLGSDDQEFSITAICDGTTAKLLPLSQDHKKVGKGDTGDNTGGMGAYAPVDWISPTEVDQAREIVSLILAGLAAEGHTFTGILYVGVMLTSDGLKVLEINVRFGDPEIVVLLPLLQTDFAEVLEACFDRRLSGLTLTFHPGYCATGVMASEGYPGTPITGRVIHGLLEAQDRARLPVFQAGTRQDGVLRTAGGRVLYPTARGETLAEAIQTMYDIQSKLWFEGAHARPDIGRLALQR